MAWSFEVGLGSPLMDILVFALSATRPNLSPRSADGARRVLRHLGAGISAERPGHRSPRVGRGRGRPRASGDVGRDAQVRAHSDGAPATSESGAPAGPRAGGGGGRRAARRISRPVRHLECEASWSAGRLQRHGVPLRHVRRRQGTFSRRIVAGRRAPPPRPRGFSRGGPRGRRHADQRRLHA